MCTGEKKHCNRSVHLRTLAAEFLLALDAFFSCCVIICEFLRSKCLPLFVCVRVCICVLCSCVHGMQVPMYYASSANNLKKIVHYQVCI